MDVRAGCRCQNAYFSRIWRAWPKFLAGCPQGYPAKNFLFGLNFRSWISHIAPSMKNFNLETQCWIVKLQYGMKFSIALPHFRKSRLGTELFKRSFFFPIRIEISCDNAFSCLERCLFLAAKCENPPIGQYLSEMILQRGDHTWVCFFVFVVSCKYCWNTPLARGGIAPHVRIVRGGVSH